MAAGIGLHMGVRKGGALKLLNERRKDQGHRAVRNRRYLGRGHNVLI